MRIAQVAPLHESVPPQMYGGTERVVSYLTEALVQQGHEVTLFASRDSVTTATLKPYPVPALRLNPRTTDAVAHHLVMFEHVFRDAHRFDIIHFHTDYLHYPITRREQVPFVTTLHGRLDLPELPLVYQEYRDFPVVSISHAQRAPLPNLNWQATVHHGLPADQYTFHPHPQGYLAFLGRISPEKRVDRAVDIALRSGMPLKIAAKVDRSEWDYYHWLRPLLDHPGIEFVGEIGERDKNDFLGKASALLFPIDWPEPFGLVMIEALACGTPVIAFPCGSVPEILRDGETGFLCTSTSEAVAAVERVPMLDRHACRQRFMESFSAARMANEYVSIFLRLAHRRERMVSAR